MKFYAGIGSRQTPPEILELMTKIAVKLREQGWTLRSGHATGADWAFEQGARENSVIYLPWPSFGQKPYKDDPGRPVLGRAMCNEELWKDYYRNVLGHQNEHSRAVTLLHGRNVAQVLGMKGGTPSSFVVCWTKEFMGKYEGGTGVACRLAKQHNIPIFNLYHKDVQEHLQQFLSSAAEEQP